MRTVFYRQTRVRKLSRQQGRGKIIICADGDVVVNDFDYRRNTPLPLGYDRASTNIFGNKDFVMHALDYMTDENGIITSRSKQISIRGAGQNCSTERQEIWQALNLLLPLIVLGIFGALRYYIRRRKFA